MMKHIQNASISVKKKRLFLSKIDMIDSLISKSIELLISTLESKL